MFQKENTNILVTIRLEDNDKKMLIIRETFITKPGKASAFAKLMTEAFSNEPAGTWRILTDSVSDFNQVVVETEIESLAKHEERMKEYEKDTSMRDKMKDYHEMFLTGKREIFKVWE